MVCPRRVGLAYPYHRDVVPEHESETWTAEPAAAVAPSPRPVAIAGPRRGLAEAILDAVVEGIVVLDPDSGRVVDLNRGAEALLGRGRDQLIGRPIADLIRRSDADRLAGFIDQVASGRRTTSTVMTEIQPADGPSIAVEVVLQAISLHDGSRAIVAIARDISERIEVQVRLQRLAQAEHARAAELNAVIRTMGEGVIVCAPDGRISLANPAAERLFPEIASQTYQEILGRLHDPGGLAPRLGSRTGPVELPFAADPDQWVELATYPVTVGIGLATAGDETIVVLRDVTDARRREAIRETFIGVLSHELRTPVTTIFGGAKLLARENRPSTKDPAGHLPATSTRRPSACNAWSKMSSRSTASATIAAMSAGNRSCPAHLPGVVGPRRIAGRACPS